MFSFTNNLLGDAANSDNFAVLFKAFYMALDERKISYIQATINLVASPDSAEEIKEHLDRLGVTAIIKNM
jgi:DNA-binding SARP family transcriptional activator